MAEEQFYSLEDVAERLQVSDQTVRRWIKAGKLRAYKPGLEWRISPKDLEEFLQARSYPKVQAPSSPVPLEEGAEEERRELRIDPGVRELRWLAHELVPGTPAEEALTRLTTGNRGFLKRALSHVLYAPSEEEDYSGWLKDDPASTMPAIKAAVRFVDKTDSDIETVYGLVENEFTERQIEAGREGQRAAEDAGAEGKEETA